MGEAVEIPISSGMQREAKNNQEVELLKEQKGLLTEEKQELTEINRELRDRLDAIERKIGPLKAENIHGQDAAGSQSGDSSKEQGEKGQGKSEPAVPPQASETLNHQVEQRIDGEGVKIQSETPGNEGEKTSSNVQGSTDIKKPQTEETGEDGEESDEATGAAEKEDKKAETSREPFPPKVARKIRRLMDKEVSEKIKNTKDKKEKAFYRKLKSRLKSVRWETFKEKGNEDFDSLLEKGPEALIKTFWGGEDLPKDFVKIVTPTLVDQILARKILGSGIADEGVSELEKTEWGKGAIKRAENYVKILSEKKDEPWLIEKLRKLRKPEALLLMGVVGGVPGIITALVIWYGLKDKPKT